MSNTAVTPRENATSFCHLEATGPGRRTQLLLHACVPEQLAQAVSSLHPTAQRGAGGTITMFPAAAQHQQAASGLTGSERKPVLKVHHWICWSTEGLLDLCSLLQNRAVSRLLTAQVLAEEKPSERGRKGQSHQGYFSRLAQTQKALAYIQKLRTSVENVRVNP